MEYKSKSETETQKIASKILSEAVKKRERPVVLALYGELGAGKTTFIKKLAAALGVKGEIRSPTFLLIREYEIPKRDDLKRLVHIDTYRIDDAHELVELGLKDILKDPKNLVVIEWAERVEELLPLSTIRILFKIVGESTRKIVIP